ncbi:alpha-2-macroglobulin family protein [Chondromyces crocatus]|uniref:Alpha-2-macroglobulin domain-containing protein n=1 Tax=Chondromyces crocatus TaxID=52 RepID=A0A0K1EG33_CHOCO|nr:alpha-2-macroglobulin family protein [Chondromyces crocatus]AKT39543.1 uncharacterized protein CMC5_036900 [Chondromyces crocatus]
MRRSRFLLSALALSAALGSAPSGAAPSGPEAVARGLDLFLHAPDRGAPGSRLPVQVVALGYPTALAQRPLEAVTVEAVWDPEHLGEVSAVPPPVQATTDAGGRAHLEVPIPEGVPQELKLLVGVRVGDRQRTQVLQVRRTATHDVALRVPDQRVVPGGALSAWVTVEGAATGLPVANAPVEVSLLEGGVARQSAVVKTDAAGVAMARVQIPWTEEPAWSWTLRARSLVAGESAGSASMSLTPREETPGEPRLTATWDTPEVGAGEQAAYVLRVRDGAELPVVGLPVRVWVGQKGTKPPTEEKAWEKASTLVHTDVAGEIKGTAMAPTTVVQGVGSELRVVARAVFEGRPLSREATVAVESRTSEVTLHPEGGVIVPGVTQRMLVRVLDGRYEPVSGAFHVEADGLRASVTTDAFGEAEVTWQAPVDLGGFRAVGPCAGGVAAAVTVRPAEAIAALRGRSAPFVLCASVNRGAGALMVPEKAVVRAGEAAAVQLRMPGPGAGLGGRGGAGGGRGKDEGAWWSTLLSSEDQSRAGGAWFEGRAGSLTVPQGAAGVWSLWALSPRSGAEALRAGGALLVTPRVLPRLEAKLVGGRAVPGGMVEVELALSGDPGGGLPGTIAAVVVDLYGGGSVHGIAGLDTRTRLCGKVSVERERCDAFLSGDTALDPLRRAALGAEVRSPREANHDPAGTATTTMREAFGQVLRSLEGAVYEASASPERMRDVARKGPGGFQFNPELMTLVTAAMDAPPNTPGGEPVGLADLVAVDGQVTFDNVARRVTRLKLFKVLSALRELRRDRQLDMDEPALKDPGALLRRAVRDEKISEDLLLDPWGGTIQFVKTGAASAPFLTVTRGFALQSPGPDGRIGTGDDVKDPFERVVRSGSPYAEALGEDEIVDARFDMEVGDATVASWERLLTAMTGMTLGMGTITTVGYGSGTGSGQGFGSGHGRLAGAHVRRSASLSTGVFYWSPPVRTGSDGKLRMKIPLGDVETTWRIAFVGAPDQGSTATTTLDVAASLPLSVRVNAGASWVTGDEVDVALSVRNRSAKALRASLAIAAEGVAGLVRESDKAQVVEVPAGGATPVRVRVRASKAGKAALSARVSAAGLEGDTARHSWEVRAPGEATDLTAAQWVEAGSGEAKAETMLQAPLDARVHVLAGAPRLVLERGIAGALSAALESVEPDRLGSPRAMADALEVAARIKRWATARGEAGAKLAGRAGEVERRAVGRLLAFKEGKREVLFWGPERRARAFAPEALVSMLPKDAGCPAEELGKRGLDEALEALEVEPMPEGGAALACWDAFVTETVAAAQEGGDAVALARAVLALAERPHRVALASGLADELRSKVALRVSGGVSLSSAQASDRGARAVVYAALLRSAGLGKSAAPAGALFGWVGVQGDVRGGYGSTLGTRSVVRALLAHEGSEKAAAGVSRVKVMPWERRAGSGGEGTGAVEGPVQEVEVGPAGQVVVPLGASTVDVVLSVVGPGVMARLERPALRRWSSPPDVRESPVQIEVDWPKQARAGGVGTLRVALQSRLGRAHEVDARIPLPPGVSLAAAVKGVRQVQGALLVRAAIAADGKAARLEIPLRFSLGGKMTVPEARAKVALEELPRAVAPARALRAE